MVSEVLERMLDEVIDTDFDTDTTARLLDEARAAGLELEFIEGLIQRSSEAGVELEIADAGSSPPPVVMEPSSDRITQWLRTVPFVGNRLASAREAAAFLRADEGDPRAVRTVKLLGRGVIIVATGATGYLIVGEGGER